MRKPLKRLLEGSLVGTGAVRVGRWLHRDRALVLAFHNVVPDDSPPAGDTSLHLPRSRFAAFLDLLAETHEVVPLEVLAARDGNGRPRAAITFDDAYRGAVTDGIAELAGRGLPGTIFVAPSFVGDRDFWWDRYADGSGATGFERLRNRALDELKGEHDAVCAWAVEAGLSAAEMPSWALVATEPELHEAVSHAGITLGSHTWSHPNLARLQPSRIEEELVRARDWLRERFEAVIPWVSYPYGRSSQAVEDTVREVGYEAALMITGGWTATPPRSPFAVPRCNIPASLSTNGFALRVSGF